MLEKFQIILIVFSICVLLFATVKTKKISENYEHCLTAANENAICVDFFECVAIRKILRKGITEKDKRYIPYTLCNQRIMQAQICCDHKHRKNINYFKTKKDLLPQPTECGFNEITDKIMGGTTTAINEFPWTAQLIYESLSNGEVSAHCGGSLINERYILTAAHCLKTAYLKLLFVRLGEWDVTTNPDCIRTDRTKTCYPGYIDLPIEKIIIHPQYKDTSNDIALLRLKGKVRYNEMINPICLPLETDLRDKTFTGENVEVVGWGFNETGLRSDIKQKAQLTVQNLVSCANIYATTRTQIEPSNMCAGGVEGIADCNGDSGGSLVWKNLVVENGKARYRSYLAGIISYGNRECGKKDWPGVYMRVGSYIDWILDMIEP